MPYSNLPIWLRYYFIAKERAIFRFDPVSGTGKKNWKFRNFYKTANCCQERRLYGDPDHREYGRGKRYPSNLPNAWDDYPKSRVHIKQDWKQVKKKKQWMKKGDNIMFPTFTPLGAESSADDVVEGDSSQKKKLNYNMSETKVKGEDYTRPGMNASQTEDDDLRSNIEEKEDYEVSGKDRLTTNENQKSPERNFGKPGIRLFEGEEEEFIEILDDDEMPPEDDTPVVVDDGDKHGPKLKWQFSGGLEGKLGTNKGE